MVLDSIRINTKITQDALKNFDSVGLRNMQESISKSLYGISKLMVQSMDISMVTMTETMRKMAIEIADIYKGYDFTGSMTDSINAMMAVISRSMVDDIKYMRESMSSIVESISKMQMESLKLFGDYDFSRLVPSSLTDVNSFADIVDVAYQSMQEEIGLEQDETEDDNLTVEEAQEILQEHFKNPTSINERVRNWTEEKKKKYFILCGIICTIFNIFILPYLQQKIGLPAMAKLESSVRELPEKCSEVICRLKENVETTIIENTNYYYKVTFIDENGVEREGYVAKRNLKLIEKTNEEEEIPVGSEIPEESE